jgi:hypothetical protein
MLHDHIPLFEWICLVVIIPASLYLGWVGFKR